MFTDLATVRSDVKTRLTPILPADWRVEASIEGTIKALSPVLYIEFVGIDPRVRNTDLPRGKVTARFNIIITDPKTDTDKAEDAVDGHILRVIRALDGMSDIFWDTCEKDRLTNGPLAWKITAFALTDTPDPDN